MLNITCVYTSIITRMGTMNAAIAPSSDVIQQLLYCTVNKQCSYVELLNTLTNDLSHSVYVLFQLKWRLLE